MAPRVVVLALVLVAAIGGPGGQWLSWTAVAAATTSLRHRVAGDDDGNLHINTSDPLKGVFINGVDILGAYRTLQEEVAVLQQNVSTVLAAVNERSQTGGGGGGDDENPTDTTPAPSSQLVTDCDAITTIALPADVSESGGKWVGGVFDPGSGRLFGIPHNADKVLVASLEMNDAGSTWTTRALSISGAASGPKKWHGGVLLNGKVYGIPFFSNHVLVIQSGNNGQLLASTQELPEYYYGAMTGKWAGAGVISSTIYCIPHGSSVVLIITPESNDGSSGMNFDTLTTSPNHQAFSGALQLSDTTIIGLPACNSEALTVTADDVSRTGVSATNMCSGISLSEDRGLAFPCVRSEDENSAYLDITWDRSKLKPAFNTKTLSVQGAWWGAGYAKDYVVALPANSDSVLILTPFDDSIQDSAIEVMQHDGKTPSFAGAVVGHDYVVGIPFDSSYIMVVDTNKLEGCLSS